MKKKRERERKEQTSSKIKLNKINIIPKNTNLPALNTQRFKDLKLDPYVLPLLKNRVLSPTSRARKVLGHTPRRKNKNAPALESSIEKSLEKIEKDNFLQFDKKYSKPVYSK